MNQITHKQAMKWIDRRLDGLLTDKQASLLGEHLRSCGACSAYAADMGLLPGYLQKEFHERWDEQPGPSQKVMQHVTEKARRIPMENRISSGTKLFAGTIALLVLGVAINFVISQLKSTTIPAVGTETVNVMPRAEDRLLAFASDQNGNYDIYTMHADGNGVTNLTNNPANDSDPFWSPDGTRIAFTSDRDGSRQVYLMDADGSNLVQLTKGEGNSFFDSNGSTPWSPDGRKLVFLQRSDKEEKYKLYSMDNEGKNKTTLTNELGEYLSPSWSPDGKHISFYEWQGGRPIKQIFVVDDTGNNLTRITGSLPRGENTIFGDYYWSPDGKSIFFTADTNKSQQTISTVYQASLDGALTVIARPERPIIDWWDGIALQLSESPLLTWIRSDGSQSALELCRSSDQVLGIAYKRSHDGNLVFGSDCSATGWTLYWANPDGTITDKLLDSGIPARNDSLFNMTWSSDDHFMAFVALDKNSPSVTETLYVLDVTEARKNPSIQPLKMTNSYGPSWQPVANNIVQEKPTPEPTQTISSDNLIAFVSTQNGNSDIYTMHADGSGVTNLTNNPAEDVAPVWSPDGTRIAFVSNRDGNLNIYVMNADGSALTRLTDDPASDVIKFWSPDSTKIAYASHSDAANISSIYIVDATGQDRRRLTENIAGPLTAWPQAWSPDGQFVFFENNLQISKVNITNGAITPITSQEHTSSQFTLSKDGSKLLYLESCSQSSAEFCTQIKSIRVDGTGMETLATEELKDFCWSKETDPTKVSTRYEMIKWSPDRTKILFSFYCKDKDGLFYIANADGSDFKPLTSYPILYEASGFDWSPDSQSIIFSSALDGAKSGSPYLLNIKGALQNPDIRPDSLSTSASQISFFAWQPVSSNKVVEEKPTPVTTPQPVLQIDHRLIAFTSATESNNLDIYTMHPDGSGLTDLTNDPASDVNPYWSPDGKHIAFESDRSGLTQIYVMDADGSNVFQVTAEEAQHQFSNSNPWSPDGNRLIFTEKAPKDENWTLYAIDLDGQNKTLLAQVPNIYTDPCWSPDGTHIAYTDVEAVGGREMVRIYVVDANGKNRTNVTKLLPPDEDLISRDYFWSSDGRSILFIAARTAWDSAAGASGKYTAYEASLDGETLQEKATSSTPMNSWWDGTAFIPGFYPYTLTWLHSDGTYNTFEPLSTCQSTSNSSVGFLAKRSASGKVMVNINCPNDDLWFYWANSDGTTIKQLLDSPIAAKGGEIDGMVWSPDDKYIAITIHTSGVSYMYVINVDESLKNPSLQPVQMALYGGGFNFNISWQPIP